LKKLLFVTAVAGIFACSSPSGSTPSGDSSKQQTVSGQNDPQDSMSVQPRTGADPVPAQQVGADSSFVGKKRALGIDFYAVGQEPGWALDMDSEKIYSFSTFDGIKMNTPPVAGTTSADGKITTYRAQVELGEINITVTREECMDSMSGEKSPCKVEVRIKRGVDKDFKTYNGCGRFL
jgi:uncharacterized membrane protein